MEMFVYEEIGSTVSTIESTCSLDWDKSLNENQVGILARESTVYMIPGECFDYECILVEKDTASSSYLNCTELGIIEATAATKFSQVHGNIYGDEQEFSHELRPREECHISLLQAIDSRLTPAAKKRIGRSDERFCRTATSLLQLIRPFSYI